MRQTFGSLSSMKPLGARIGRPRFGIVLRIADTPRAGASQMNLDISPDQVIAAFTAQAR